MSTIGPPVVIAAGGSAQVPQPQYGGNIGGVVLDNLSTYLLQISIGASTYYLDPLMSQFYPIESNSGPIGLQSFVQAGDVTTQGTIAPTFYGSDEPLPGTYPVALSGPASIAAAIANAAPTNGLVETVIAPAYFYPVEFGGTIYTISGFASIIVKMSVGSGTAIQAANFQQSDTALGLGGRMFRNDRVSVDNRPYEVWIPVVASLLQINTESAGSPIIIYGMTGTSRVVDDIQMTASLYA